MVMSSADHKLYAAAVVPEHCDLVSPDLQDMDLHHILPQIRVSDFGDVHFDNTIHESDSDHLLAGDDCDVGGGSIGVTKSCGSINESVHRLSVPGMEISFDISPTDGEPSSPSQEVARPSQDSWSESESSLQQQLQQQPAPPPSPHSEQWWSGKYDFAAKVIVLGDYGVGKSTLLSTLAHVKNLHWCRCIAYRKNEFVEMECRKNEKKVLIRIVDTGGQERFRSMTSSYFRGAHGCLIMFNVTNEDSFNNVITWFNDLSIYAQADNVSSMVVGAITTTPPPSPISSSTDAFSMNVPDRVVTAERAFRLAESLNLTYCETNVKDSQTVLWILTRLVNSVIISRARRQSLAITIMPSVRASLSRSTGGDCDEDEVKKRRWKCCSTS